MCFITGLLSGEPSQALQSAVTTAPKMPSAGPTESTAPEWSEIHQPSLQVTFKAPQQENVRHKLFGGMKGAREEVLTWGSLDAAEFHAQIVVRYAGDTPPREEDGLFVTSARLAAASGIALTRIATPFVLPTKFGDVEAADARMLADTSSRACLVFRQRRAGSSFGIAGWYCGTPERPTARDALSCFIDRLDLSSGSEEPQLQRIFATADVKQTLCPGDRPENRLTSLNMRSRLPAIKTEARSPAKVRKPLSRRHRHRK